MNIGERIKQIRIKKHLKQSELAEKSGLSRVAIGNYERGDRNPNVETLNKIADALEVSLPILLWDDTKFIKDLLSYFQAAYHIKENYFPQNHQIINILVDEKILPEERLDVLLDDINNLSIDEIQKIFFYVKKLDIDTFNKFINDKDLVKVQILGENIKNQRNNNNLSLNDLSLRCGLDIYYLERLENGFSDYPPNDMIREIAEVLDVTVTQLIKEINPMENLINITNKEYYNNLKPSELKELLNPYLNLNTTVFENMTTIEKEKLINDLCKMDPFKFKLQKYLDNFDTFSKEDLINISNELINYGYDLVTNFYNNNFSNLANDYSQLVEKYNNLTSEYNNLVEVLSIKDKYIESLKKSNTHYQQLCNEAQQIFNKISNNSTKGE